MVRGVKFVGTTGADPLRVGDLNPLLAALAAGGQPFCVAADGGGVEPDRAGADPDPRWPRQCDHDTLLLDLPPDRWHRFLEPGKRVVGAVQWPASRPPGGWVDAINAHAQSCVVPSEWNRLVFAEAGVRVPIHVVPRCRAAATPATTNDRGAGPGSDHGATTATPWRVADVADDAYKFYAVLDFTERGNPAGLVKAYWCAFQRGERVALILHAARAGLGARSRDAMLGALRRTREITRLPQYPPVHLVADPLSSAALAGLHALGDCFVSLARGSSCGGPALDAAARGKPVIGTGYGGLGELVDTATGYPVRHSLTPVSGMATEPGYTADQFWAEPDLAHAIGQLRHLYAHRDEARARGEALRRRVAEGCDPARVSAALRAAIEAAHGR
jgi:hypothetical protein